MIHKTALVILDGWGIGKHDATDAIWMAKTPFTDSLYKHYPNCQLRTDGENVGLPEGQMGNSEVGHMNIGAGRIVWQMLVKINKEFKEGGIAGNAVMQQAFQLTKTNKKSLHLIGLVSNGGVHSHQKHLIGLCREAAKNGVENIYIHAFTDGRDTDPKSSIESLDYVLKETESTGAKLSTVIGRYYAMDRDNRWQRIARAYDLMVCGTGEYNQNVPERIQKYYDKRITDEFMEPIRCLPGDEGLIANGDVVLCFNFRTDRGRQITRALSQEDFPEFGMKKLDLHYFTLTEYDETFKIDGILFENQNLLQTLGQVISEAGATQLRAAETEKYPHVTFFFSGGKETPYTGEKRLLVNSPTIATYDLQPEMSANELTKNAIKTLENNSPDFICINFANADMVGHTGVLPAIIKAVETVDRCLQNLVFAGLKSGYKFVILADHGNADLALNDDGSPNTAHTLNPVPCWVLGAPENTRLNNGVLADIAPTVLQLMGITQPVEMTGIGLII